MFRTIILALTFAMASWQPAQAQSADSEGVNVTVTRSGGGGRIVFDLPKEPNVWAFPASAISSKTGEPWRPASWRILTPGVRLIRRNNLDAMVLNPEASRRVEIEFDLYSSDLVAAYEPAIIFDGGDAALYTGQYLVAPLETETALDQGPDSLRTASEWLTFRQDGATLLANGHSAANEVSFRAGDNATYVFIGKTPLLETAEIAAVIDAGLPEWIQDGVKALTPSLLNYFTRRLGSGLKDRPTLYVGWGGSGGSGMTIGGGTLPGLIAYQVSGAGASESSPTTRRTLTGIIAHEVVHFWIGQGVRPVSSVAEAWVHEGAAEAASFRALGALDPTFDITPAFQKALDRCQAALERGPLTTAIARGDQRANYDCGAVFHLTVEQRPVDGQAGFDLLDFWQDLLDAKRTDGRVGQEDWLSMFRAKGHSREASDIIARLATQGSQNSSEDLARLFDVVGVAYNRTSDGALVLSKVSSIAFFDPEAATPEL